MKHERNEHIQRGDNEMSNSSLVSYTKISPNRTSPRNHKIDTISVHCYVGQVSIEDMASWLCNPEAEASANYGIGKDGRIGQFVGEEDRSWCSSNRDNDNRAITIECASDTTHPYAVNEKVFAALIDLLVDICKRNGIKELKWKADKSLIGNVEEQNMTVHRWFANKECPGDYLYNRHFLIADEVNRRLNDMVDVSTGTQTCEFSDLSEENAAARLLEICKPIALSNGLFPSVCTAQTILESGYCKTELATVANNVCGMKCELSGNTWSGSTWDGESKVKIRTAEQDSYGNVYYILADFRKYSCIEDSIADRCAYLLGAKNGTKLRYEGIKQCGNYKEQISLIKNGGYATDTQYVSKICNIIERFKLDVYDDELEKSVKYYVRKSWMDSQSQIGAYEILDNAKEEVNRNWQYNVYDSTGKEIYNGRKALIDRAVDFSVGIANDNTHGYQNGAWGPEYSCISLVETALIKSGLSVKKSNIDKMPKNLLAAGFEECTSQVDFITGKGLAKGYILWMLDGSGKHGHTEMAVSESQIVGARGDTDGKSGDGHGDEISVISYTNMGWQRVFRLPGGYTGETKEENENISDNLYKVQAGAYENANNAQKICKKIVGAGYPAFVKVEDDMYKIQAGAYSSKDNAERQVELLKSSGFEACIKTDSPIYTVQTGLFENKKNAEALATKMKDSGFDAVIIQNGNQLQVRGGLFSIKANAERLVKCLKEKGFDALIK